MERLNFSWLIPGEVAGHAGAESVGDLRYLKVKGIKALVRMAQPSKALVKAGQVVSVGFTDCYEPTPDFTAPNRYQLDRMIAFIRTSLDEGRPVGVSCRAGLGRTGTVLACYLVSRGYTASAAIAEVRSKRPGSIETQAQEEAVKTYEGRSII